MGASGWHYIVPYQPDLGAALDALRADVFRRKAYYPKRAHKAKTIAAAIELAAEDGTHSVLDVNRIDTVVGHGAVTLVDLGTPTRAQAELQVHTTLLHALPRWTGIVVVIYSPDGTPSELLFAGKTGD